LGSTKTARGLCKFINILICEIPLVKSTKCHYENIRLYHVCNDVIWAVMTVFGKALDNPILTWVQSLCSFEWDSCSSDTDEEYFHSLWPYSLLSSFYILLCDDIYVFWLGLLYMSRTEFCLAVKNGSEWFWLVLQQLWQSTFMYILNILGDTHWRHMDKGSWNYPNPK
jgi:hypothetical protein